MKRGHHLTWCSLNWSPPKAATQGLMPPVPRAMRNRPTMDNTLKCEEQTWIQCTVWNENCLPKFYILVSDCIIGNSHMKGHVVWYPVSVCVSDVMDSTDCHCNLTNCIDNGQVDDCPARERRKEMSNGEKTHIFYLRKYNGTTYIINDFDKHYCICIIQTLMHLRNLRWLLT